MDQSDLNRPSSSRDCRQHMEVLHVTISLGREPRTTLGHNYSVRCPPLQFPLWFSPPGRRCDGIWKAGCVCRGRAAGSQRPRPRRAMLWQQSSGLRGAGRGSGATALLVAVNWVSGLNSGLTPFCLHSLVQLNQWPFWHRPFPGSERTGLSGRFKEVWPLVP